MARQRPQPKTKSPPIPPSPSEADYQDHDDSEVLAKVGQDPIALFLEWLEEATRKEPNDANAMTLATVDREGMPDARMVLLKGVDNGFAFYTNLQSAKGEELKANPRAALVFHWKSLRRQVRVRGLIQPVTPEEADAYFATRARASQIGAWASAQSRPLEGPHALEAAAARFGARYALGPVPRPPHWSGFRLIPLQIEFWRSRRFRLHERLQFCRADPGRPWESRRLYP